MNVAAPMLSERDHAADARYLLDMHGIDGVPGRSWPFVIEGTPKTWPKPQASVEWYGVWDLARRWPRSIFARGKRVGGPSKGHLVHMRPGDHHDERVAHIRKAWDARYGRFRAPIFHGPVLLIVTAVWNAPSPVGKTRGKAKATKPDTDNAAAKLIMDAFSPDRVAPSSDRIIRNPYPGLWPDDELVAHLSCAKRYAHKGEESHTLVVITEIGDAPTRQGSLLA